MATIVYLFAAVFAIGAALLSPKMKRNEEEHWSPWLWFFIVMPIITFCASVWLQRQSDSKEKKLLITVQNAESQSIQANRTLNNTSQQLRTTQSIVEDLQKKAAYAEKQRDQAVNERQATLRRMTESQKYLSLANTRLAALSDMVAKLVPSGERSVHRMIVSLGGKILAAEDGHITGVSLAETPVTDDQLTELSKLAMLRELDLRKTQITDNAVKYLPAFANLEVLYLNDCPKVATLDGLQHLTTLTTLELDFVNVTDEDLQHLAGLRGLEELSLYVVSAITDAGLVHLRGLTKLKNLNLSGTKITDKGLDELTPLKNLELLHLGWDEITDDGLKRLQAFLKIEQLWLGYTKITDDGLTHLTALRNLSNLQIRHTGITDAGLLHLQKMSKLYNVNLTGTLVSDEGVSRLKAALPGLRYVVR